MRKFYIALGFICAAMRLSAHNIANAEINYNYLGGDSFEVVQIFYASCFGADFHSLPIKITPENGQAFTVLPVLVSTSDITPVCSNSCTRCSNSSCTFPFGIMKEIHKAVIHLGKYTECRFILSISYSSRNSALTTGGAGTNLYIESMLDKCAVGPHSSPHFAGEAPTIWCKNQCGSISLHALSDDYKDSFVYALVPALTGPNSPINMVQAYTYQKPFKFSGSPDTTLNTSLCTGIRYDAHTGAFNFKPVAEDITVIVYKVSQYRKDNTGKYQLIGFVTRENQLAIIQCPEYLPDGKTLNYPPSLSGINGGKSNSIIACPDVELNFQVNLADKNKDELVLTWDKSIPGASLSYTHYSSVDDKAIFKWTPKKSDVRDEPYYITLTVNDNWCPIPTPVQRRYAIYVKNSFPAYTYTKTDSGCGNYYFQVKTTDPGQQVKCQWRIGGGPIISTADAFPHRFTQNGTYVLQGYLTAPVGCGKYTYDTVKITGLTVFDAGNDTTICIGSVAHLNASGGEKYHWFGKGILDADTAHAPRVQPLETITYTTWKVLLRMDASEVIA